MTLQLYRLRIDPADAALPRGLSGIANLNSFSLRSGRGFIVHLILRMLGAELDLHSIACRLRCEHVYVRIDQRGRQGQLTMEIKEARRAESLIDEGLSSRSWEILAPALPQSRGLQAASS